MARPPKKHKVEKKVTTVKVNSAPAVDRAKYSTVKLGPLKIGLACSPACCFKKVYLAPPDISSEVHQKEALKVKKIVRLFNAHRRRLAPQEAARVKDLPKGQPRPDKKAGIEMAKSNQKSPWHSWGHVPGIPVGAQFHSREELRLVGLTKGPMAGISTSKLPNFGSPTFATCVVMSGDYEDDLDKGDEFEYTGQGGNDLTGDKTQYKDQAFTRGNLALYENHKSGVPVRVVRKNKEPHSYTGHVYTYDGLYHVVNGWEEEGKKHMRIFKYHLKRAPNQPETLSSFVEFQPTSLKKTTSAKNRKGLLLEDLSGGVETLPVCLVNTVDKEGPPQFEYISEVKENGLWQETRSQRGCSCGEDGCDWKTCHCIRQGSHGQAVYTDKGLLIETVARGIYECGASCKCGPDCGNRVTQQGLQFRLEVFKSKDKGWGVRSWDAIPNGSHVITYVGDLLSDSEAEALGEGKDTYFFNLATLKHAPRWGRTTEEEEGTSDEDPDVDESLVIDAAHCGNVSRFINHSCDPNVVVQTVFKDGRPSIEFFAADDIKPLHELGYDYNYEIGSIRDKLGKERKLFCKCAAPNCRKRMF